MRGLVFAFLGLSNTEKVLSQVRWTMRWWYDGHSFHPTYSYKRPSPLFLSLEAETFPMPLSRTVFQLRLRGQVTCGRHWGPGLGPCLGPLPFLLQPVAAGPRGASAGRVHRAAALLPSQLLPSLPVPFLSVVRDSFRAWNMCLLLAEGHLFEEVLLPRRKREPSRPVLRQGHPPPQPALIRERPSTGELHICPGVPSAVLILVTAVHGRDLSDFADGETEAWVLLPQVQWPSLLHSTRCPGYVEDEEAEERSQGHIPSA